MRVRLEYGRTGLEVDLPDRPGMRTLSYKDAAPLPDPDAALRTDDLHRDLPRRSVRSGAVLLMGQLATVGLGFVSASLLARLLTPED